MRRVLVTGATGFLGQHLVAALLAEGVPTTALCRRGGLPAGLGHPALAVAPGDLRDEDTCASLLAGVDTVFHLAAVRNLPGTPARAMEEVNEIATLRLARQAVDAGVDRFVHVATAQVYGPSASPLDETSPVLSPPATTRYAGGKGRAVLRLREMARAGAPVVTLLPTIVFGPDQPSHPNRVTSHLRRLASSRIQPVLGDGNARRDLVHVGDVVAALLAAARLPGLAGEELLVTGEAVSSRALGTLVARCQGRRPPIVARLPLRPARVAARLIDRARGYDPGGGWASAVDTLSRDWCFRGDRARRVLGHRSRPLAEGIAQTLAWIDAGDNP
jgi:nucleoside-diphosphate-sugar epimerase